ncbi:peptide/nickel transport system substrate-binding protein [Tepidamorphus gemmatus]|uniref:Peptide/nickel transport system substrate-binding protein n=2 Tax=Tepidamorphus gemmatus TaxID=747076 RepID=A0A4V2UXZ7_9HYPH|nr:ABC transporter substrate-binding protein [Tepidamorphus gemmatus]TCT05438.1 peptide/nickel transport system substrate-binding protein [Tepidamorphus gemmatus]
MRRLGLIAALALAAASIVAPAAAQRTDITMGMVLEPPHLDPTAGAAAAIREVGYRNIFEGLTRIDRNGAVQPLLARDWEISDDGLVYTFHLQEGVKFHDGSPMTSADVAFSFKRAMAEDSVNAQKQLFEPIEKLETPDDHTVVITLKRPTGHFPFNLGWGDMVIVSPASADTNKTRPIGTGPFRFAEWVPGDRIVLTRNPDYWGEPVALERATFKIIPDPAAAVAAMMAGDVDAFANFPAPEAIPQFEADPRFTVVIGSTEGETILAINNGRPPFDDLKVRQAIAHAIDRQAIIEGAMFGLGTPIGSHFAPHHPAYVDLTGVYPYDPAKAKALLAEAGHADGIKATLKLPPPSYARRGGEVIAEQLRQVGIDLEIIPVEWAQWLEQVFRGKDYDLTIVSHTEPMDIEIYGRDDYYFNYHNPAFREVLDRLAAETDTQKRYALMGEAQKILAADAVNAFLFQLAKAGVWDARLEGLWENSPIPANDLTEVRWKE